MPISPFLGPNIRFLRLRLDMTQAELATIVGVSSGAISKYENGTDSPAFAHLYKIVQHFDVSFDDLIMSDISKGPKQAQDDQIILKLTRQVEETSARYVRLRDKIVSEIPEKAKELGIFDEE